MSALAAQTLELLDLHALGLLEGEERAQVEALLADPGAQGRAAREVLARAEAVVGALALPTALEPAPAGLKERLLAGLDAPAFAGFARRVAGLLDLSLDKARELLGWIRDPGRWEMGASEECWVMHLPYGPQAQVTNAGFVRLYAGASFPEHTHVGRETMLVLQGSLRDSDGGVHRAGELCEFLDGTTHSFVALEGEELIYLALLEEGIVFHGEGFDL